MEYLGYGGNGQYGLDSIAAYFPVGDIGFGMDNVLMTAINTTEYFLGQFGLGISAGRFDNKIGESALMQAVKQFGWVPSYSYGYTAGAFYKNTPCSVTLGGFDNSRLVPHDTEFTLTKVDNSPRATLRGLQVSNPDKPKAWDSSTQILSSYNTSFSVLIDSTTPYMWLPDNIADNFAATFNLTYNSTYDLYTLTNDQYRQYSESDAYSFTFSFSSVDNHDNFGLPLNIPGVVNITVPIRSFVGTLQYPFAKGAIKYGDPAVPYFMLRRAKNETNAIMGRGFLQESYLITKYDEGSFKIHQAKFPKDAVADAHLVPIKQSSNSPYPPPLKGDAKKGLSTGQMVGIAVGAVLACALSALALWCWRKRRAAQKAKKRATSATDEEGKDIASIASSESPMTPVTRIFSRIVRRKRSRRTDASSDTGNADDDHIREAPNGEIYELPAPPPPAELAGNEDDDSNEETELGTDNSQNLSAYELAKRKLDRQLQGPVPAYAPPANGMFVGDEKGPIDGHHPTPLQPVHFDQPQISPTRSHDGMGTNVSLPITLPSPVSPRTDWNTHSTDLPSPITASVPANSSASSNSSGSRKRRRKASDASTSSREHGSNSASSASRSNSDRSTASEARVSMQGAIQRTPIDPSRVVCLGPLPGNVKMFRQPMTPQGSTFGSNERPATAGAAGGHFRAMPHISEGSLGSNFTEEEDRIVEEMTRQSVQMPTGRPHSNSLPARHAQIRAVPPSQSAQSMTIANPNVDRDVGHMHGDELIHVPQMAEQRYSWEEER